MIATPINKTIVKAGEKGFRHKNSLTDDTLAILTIKESKEVRAAQVFHHSRSKNITQVFHFNKATGKKITLTTEPTKNYPGDGAFTLVNGVQNEKGLARSREVLGWSGDDLEAVIDLGKEESISSAVIHALTSGGSWVYPPEYAELFVSGDGQSFTSIGKSDKFEKTSGSNGVIKLSFAPVSTRYIKVLVKNMGKIPEGKPGAGNKPWLMVDEIEVN